MKPIEAFLIVGAFVASLLILTAILENTLRGQRFLSPPETPPIYACCVRARSGRTDAGYWHHRVRDHGEGAA